MTSIASNLPWIEKYRPQNLSDLIDHQVKIQTLRTLIKKKELPHLLFYGKPGSGKTSCILAIAYEMYGPNYRHYVLELNASDERGIETVRTTIPRFIRASSDHLKLIILDEADAMTQDAQSALRRVIEKYTSQSRFCLICNDINKIISGLQSRCTRMRFNRLKPTSIRSKLEQIINLEQVRITDSAIDRLIHLNTDFRQILNTLQCLHSITNDSQRIEADQINHYLGIPTKQQINQVLDIIQQSPLDQACVQMNQLLLDHIWSFPMLISYLSKYLLANQLELSEQMKQRTIQILAQIEVNLAQSNDLELQMYAMIASFQEILTTAEHNPK